MARILVIDSDVGLLLVVSEFLLELGHEVMLCHSAFQAIERMDAFGPDLITTNLRVAGEGTCFDVIRACREHRNRPPVIVMSGCDAVDTITEVMKQGAFEYLVKPVNAGQLQRTILRALDFHGPSDWPGLTVASSKKEAAAAQNALGLGAHPSGRHRGFYPKRRFIALATATVLFGAWLFPPWVHSPRPGYPAPEIHHASGFFPLWDTRQGESQETWKTMVSELDLGRLVGETGLVLILGGGLMVLFRRQPSSSRL